MEAKILPFSDFRPSNSLMVSTFLSPGPGVAMFLSSVRFLNAIPIANM